MRVLLKVLLSLSAAQLDGGTSEAPLQVRQWELMHTRETVALAGVSEEQALPAFDEAQAIFTRVEAVMNEWDEGSPLGRINREAGKAAVTAPADLCEVLRLSLDGARQTEGLFDPTWAALRGVWRFGADPPPGLPDRGEVAKACALISWRDVELRPMPKPTAEAACRVRLRRAGMQLGLGGIAKGWAVDRVVEMLRKRGLRDFYVQAGGDLYLGGKSGVRAWRVGIRDPRGPVEQTFARIELADSAFSTSGDYERFFLLDGRRYHHLIDPRTCWPATASVSSTVMARTAVDAEFLTKATFILGPGKAEKLAAKRGASVVLVDPRGGVHLSPGLEGRLTWWPPSGFGEGPADAGIR